MEGKSFKEKLALFNQTNQASDKFIKHSKRNKATSKLTAPMNSTLSSSYTVDNNTVSPPNPVIVTTPTEVLANLPSPLPQIYPKVKAPPIVSLTQILPLVTPDPNGFVTKEPVHTIRDPSNQFYNSLIGSERLPTGSLRFGKQLGSGAFGYVYLGQWGTETVALKVIDPEHAQKKLYGAFEPHQKPTLAQLSEALQWEVLGLGSINHPNVVQFHGIYQHQFEGATYLVMAYCAGGTLESALKKNIPWSKRWQWALEITQGLEAIHNQGLLHRDLKAENVLINYDYRAQLADLGVAQLDQLLQETEAEVVQKGLQDKRFIAPETLKNTTISNQATDIYALGLVFWEILTGQQPRRLHALNQKELQTWLDGRGDREPLPETTIQEKTMAALIRCCWQHNPNQRPNATALLQALKEHGSVFHPKAEHLILAQAIDGQIHSQRKHLRNHQNSCYTQHALIQTADEYWQVREKEDYQVEQDLNPPKSLSKLGEMFLKKRHGTLLLLGEPGLGKTLWGYRWAHQQLKACFNFCDDPSGSSPLWPLLLRHHLPAWTQKTLENSFKKLETDLPQLPYLLIVDGYDELVSDLEVSPLPNLRKHLGLSETTPMLVSFRPNTVPNQDIKSRFGETIELAHLLPFSQQQYLD